MPNLFARGNTRYSGECFCCGNEITAVPISWGRDGNNGRPEILWECVICSALMKWIMIGRSPSVCCKFEWVKWMVSKCSAESFANFSHYTPYSGVWFQQSIRGNGAGESWSTYAKEMKYENLPFSRY